jgi:outer membrane protein assembly factor BamC
MMRVFLFSLLAILVSACGSDGEERPDYLDSTSLGALEVPPQLTRPSTSEELKIAEPSAKVLAQLQAGDKVEGQVAPKFKGVTLKSEQGIYWLEIDENADAVWPVLRDFWGNEGIKLEREEALLGLMETEWLKEYMAQIDRESGFFKRVLKRVSPDVMDKFRMTVDRAGNQTRVYINHRGLAIAMNGEVSRWVARESDAALEKEMLYRLSLFVGLNKAQVDEQFAGYVPYQTRIKSVAGSENSFELSGRRELAWKRVQHAVNQLGAKIIEQSPQQDRMVIEVSEITVTMAEDKSEFDSAGVEGAYEQTHASAAAKQPAQTQSADEAVKLTLALQENNQATVMTVTDVNGKAVSSGFAYDAMKQLAILLK